ncbi:MAG: hybrid sensor histidine kinase/response regulator [Novosphingobium sp.]|nr:hybrid sensor histidine kinase/response regulator [Novosphingobium sp.]
MSFGQVLRAPSGNRSAQQLRVTGGNYLVRFGLGIVGLGSIALVCLDEISVGESSVVHLATAVGLLLLVAGAAFALRSRAANAQTDARMGRDLEAAQSASAAKSRYLASVSHEIRSPLNAIYGYAQLIENEASVDPVEAARVIRRSAEHLTNLVEGLLDIASVEQGMVRIDSTVARLVPLVEQVAEMFRPMAELKGLVFRCELPERLPEFVRMDTRRVRQVLINLVSNAVKFTQAGEVVLALRWSGQTATFEVRDTGPGIDEAQREQVFAPYERMGDVAHGDNSGAGLGLAISRAIVQMMGGDLQVESTAGQGSCFRLRLLMPQVSGFVECDAGAVRPTGYAGRRRAILLVDDNPDHLGLLRSALGELGFDMAQASDGQTALAMSERGRFDAVILDVSMPGISGWETAAHLRAVHGRDLAIVMLSANAEERHGLDGQAADHDHFLLKPIDLSVLIDALGRVLSFEWTWPAPSPNVAMAAVKPVMALSEAAREHAENLKSLVRIGHVRALEGEIRNLERADPGAAPLAAKLYDCLDRFDLAAMGRTLEDL